MATRSQLQVTWPTSSNTGSVTAGSSVTSEVMTLDASCTAARIALKVDITGTPATDDQIYFWLLETTGDPDGAGSDEYTTVNHAELLDIVDGNSEDPAIVVVDLPLPQDHFKIYAEGSTAGTTNTVTVSAKITQQIT